MRLIISSICILCSGHFYVTLETSNIKFTQCRPYINQLRKYWTHTLSFVTKDTATPFLFRNFRSHTRDFIAMLSSCARDPYRGVIVFYPETNHHVTVVELLPNTKGRSDVLLTLQVGV